MPERQFSTVFAGLRRCVFIIENEAYPTPAYPEERAAEVGSSDPADEARSKTRMRESAYAEGCRANGERIHLW